MASAVTDAFDTRYCDDYIDGDFEISILCSPP